MSGSRGVAASRSHTAVAAAATLRRHTLRLLLRQQRRCGVTLANCCCGSRDVAASHSQAAVAAAETLRRHTRSLLDRSTCASGGVHRTIAARAPVVKFAAPACNRSTCAKGGTQLLQRSQHMRRGGVHRTSPCLGRSKCVSDGVHRIISCR